MEDYIHKLYLAKKSEYLIIHICGRIRENYENIFKEFSVAHNEYLQIKYVKHFVKITRETEGSRCIDDHFSWVMGTLGHMCIFDLFVGNEFFLWQYEKMTSWHYIHYTRIF